MAAKLVAEEGLLKGLVLSLEEGEQWVIGRDPDSCQLLIEDPSASRKHMVCRTTPQGIQVENLSSTNPVQVNDVEVTKPQLLHNGDALKIGSGVFRFYAEAAAQLFEDAANEQATKRNGEVTAPVAPEKNGSHNEQQEESSEFEEPEEAEEQKPADLEDVSEEMVGEEPSINQEQEAAPQDTSPEALAVDEPKTEDIEKIEELLVDESIDESISESSDKQEEPKVDEPVAEAITEPLVDQPIENKTEVKEDEPVAETLSEPLIDQPVENKTEVKVDEPVTETLAETTTDQVSTSEQNAVEVPEESKEPEEIAKNESDAVSSPQPETIEKENEALASLTTPPSPLEQLSEEDEDIDLRHDSIFNEEPTEKDNLAEINFGLIDAGRWLLKVVGGPNNGAEFSMATDSSYILGTDPNSCDIVFHDTSVSRQHARLSISLEDALSIEDLKSRNGTLVDGETLKGKQPLPPNILVSIGTTSFVVFDREGEMKTIISPLLPSIVKVLQKEESTAPAPSVSALDVQNADSKAKPDATVLPTTEELNQAAHHPTTTIGAFILIGILTGLFVIVGIGTSTLFKSEPVVAKEQVDPTKVLDDALAPFSPSVKYTFNRGTGRLLLVGHVLTASDKNQLLYSLQGMKFIKNLDDSGIVIDEYVWHEINQVLEKNPNWQGISVQSPSAGHFILSGYLQTRAQAARLDDYMSNNFPYLDLLEKKIVVDEDIVGSVNTLLDNMGFKNIKVKLENGEVTLSGKIPIGKSADVDSLLAEVRNLHGIRIVRNMLTEVAPDQSMINISDKYQVTGVSNQGGNLNVIINGRILMKGDVLDGMTITSVQTNSILLEKEGIKYRIDFSK